MTESYLIEFHFLNHRHSQVGALWTGLRSWDPKVVNEDNRRSTTVRFWSGHTGMKCRKYVLVGHHMTEESDFTPLVGRISLNKIESGSKDLR